MTIVYFPAPLSIMCHKDKGDLCKFPSVNWGTICSKDDLREQLALVTLYETNHFENYDGLPSYEFQSDAEWKKLPKNWTYDIDLTKDRRSISEEREVFLKEAAGLKYSHPNDLLYAIGKGWLLPRSKYVKQVRAEIKNKKYRLVLDAPSWTLTYGTPPTETTMLCSKLFTDYDDAMDSASEVCDQWEREVLAELAVDKADSIRWVLSHVNLNKIDNCRFVTENLPWGIDTMLRVFDGHVLYRYRSEDDWVRVFEV